MADMSLDFTGGAPKKLPFDEEVRQRIAQNAQRRALGVGGSSAAEAAAGAAGPATTDAAGVAGGAGFVPAWMKTGMKWGGKIAAPLGLAGAGYGAGSAAADTMPGATFENRPERALKILGGLDTTGLGARLGNWMTGTPEPKEYSPIMGPAAIQFAEKGPGSFGALLATAAANPAAELPGPFPQPAAPAAPTQTWNNQPYQPLQSVDQTDAQGNLVHRTITGTGNAQGYGSDQARAAGYGAAPRRGGYADLISLGMMVGERKRNQAGELAAAKGAPAAMKAVMDMQGEQLAQQTYQAVLARTGDPALAMAAYKGHQPAQDLYATEPSMTGNASDPRVRTNKRTGEVQQVIPRPANIEEHIKADMKAKGLSRAQVLEAYRAKGIDVKGL